MAFSIALSVVISAVLHNSSALSAINNSPDPDVKYGEIRTISSLLIKSYNNNLTFLVLMEMMRLALIKNYVTTAVTIPSVIYATFSMIIT